MFQITNKEAHSFKLGCYTIILFLILFDPAGSLGLKTFLVAGFLSCCIFENLSKSLSQRDILRALVGYIFILLFIGKQIHFYEMNEVAQVVATTLFFTNTFLLNRSALVFNAVINALALLLVVNFCSLMLGFFFVEYAIATNQALKSFGWFSLENRSHFISDFSYYHNSIYTALLILPFVIDRYNENNRFSVKNFYSLFLVFSLLLSQSRTVLLGFVILITMKSPKFVTVFLFCIAMSLFAFFDFSLDQSSSTKVQYISTFFEQFPDTLSVLIGTGPIEVDWGSSIGTHSVIELTYFEFLRYFGVFGYAFLILFAVEFWFHKRCLMTSNQKKMIIIFFTIIFFNPYFWGFTGAPIVALLLSRSQNGS